MTKKFFRIGLLILTSLVICFSSSYAQKKQEDPYKRAKAKVKELQKKQELLVFITKLMKYEGQLKKEYC